MTNGNTRVCRPKVTNLYNNWWSKTQWVKHFRWDAAFLSLLWTREDTLYPLLLWMILHIYLMKTWLNILPGQGPELHGRTSFLGPTQSEPLLIGGGLVQLRDRTWLPSPQEELHGPQWPRSVKPPSTVKKSTRHSVLSVLSFRVNCFKNYYLTWNWRDFTVKLAL